MTERLRIAAVGTEAAEVRVAEVVAAGNLTEALAREPDFVLLPADALRRLLADSPDRRISELRHALNNDLTAVLGFSQLLVHRKQELPEAAQKRVERVFEHAKRMSERLVRPAPEMPVA